MSSILNALYELVEDDAFLAVCTACFEVAYGVEPDAEDFQCESCGVLAVCSAERLLLSKLTI